MGLDCQFPLDVVGCNFHVEVSIVVEQVAERELVRHGRCETRWSVVSPELVLKFSMKCCSTHFDSVTENMSEDA